MLPELEEFTRQLQALNPAPDADVVAILYDLVDPIGSLPGAEAIIPEIFSFMERCPDVDIGSPGPLVHFVERFYPIYLKQLVASIDRQPTHLTLWMLNRILNSQLPIEQRANLIQVLRSAQVHPKAGATAKSAATDFLAHQYNNG